MPLFSSSSPFDADVEKATSELNTSENWQAVMDICDRISRETNGPKDALRAIMKRVTNRNPHIGMQALMLLSACISNCGKVFHLEVCSREFVNEAKQIIQTRSLTHPKVQEQLKEIIVEMEEMFKDDSQLSLVSTMKSQLKADGVEFPAISKSSSLSQSSKSSSSNNSLKSSSDSLSKEEEDLARAIQLSLQESESSKPKVSSLYPTVQPGSSSSPSSIFASINKKIQRKKVKALYDFEAAEDNELTFKTGDIISVLDDSDANWWKGETYDGIGLFPSNFVTTDLSEPKPAVKVERKKRVRWADTPAGQQAQRQQQQQQQQVPKPELSESVIDQCLMMLKGASVETEDEQEEDINELEDTCQGMEIVVDEKIDNSKKKHQDLSSLNEQYIQALALYQKLMKEPLPIPPTPQVHALPGYSVMPQAVMGGYQQPVGGYQPPQYQQVYASQVPTGYPHSSNPQATQAAMTMNSAYSSQGPGLPSYQGVVTSIPQGYPTQAPPTQAPPHPPQYMSAPQLFAAQGVPHSHDYASQVAMQQYHAQSLPGNSLPGYSAAHQPQMVYTQQQLL